MTKEFDKESPQPQPLWPFEKDYLFACILRLPTMFDTARQILTPHDIDRIREVPYLVLWQAATAVADVHGGVLPTPDSRARLLVEMEARKIADEDPETVKPEHCGDLFGDGTRTSLFDLVYGLESTDLGETGAHDFLRRYLHERTVQNTIRRYASGMWSVGLGEFIDKIERRQTQITTLGATQDFDIAMPDASMPAMCLYKTGVDFLDMFMDGGQALGEVYTIMGPTGAGKSTLAMKVAVRSAMDRLQRFIINREPIAYWYFFTYESEVRPTMNNRVLCHLARVPEKELMAPALLSRAELQNYKPYEMERMIELSGKMQSGELMPGEYERINNAMRLLFPEENNNQSNLKLIDYSGRVGNAGGGGVNEIVAYLRQQELLGRCPGGVVIDHAREAVERFVSARNVNPKDAFSYYSRYIFEVRDKIATRFNCSVWVVHQLHGDSSKRAFGAKVHHAEAYGSRNFCDGVSFAFCIGNKNPESRVQIFCTKQRRNAELSPVVVMLDGAVRDMYTDNTHVVSGQTHRVESKTNVAKVISPDELKQRRYFDPAADDDD